MPDRLLAARAGRLRFPSTPSATMSLLSRLERRFGRWAIPNLTTILIVGQAALYVAQFAPQGIAPERIALDPAKVMQGEVWRLATFLLVPPARETIGTIFVIFYFLLLHLFGTTLERQWGDFRYNVYLLIGWAANVVAAFAASAAQAAEAGAEAGADAMSLAPIAAPNAFLYGSIFLAFARLYPDFIINLFFVLPIRIRWLALLMWFVYAYQLATGSWAVKLAVVATVLNYLLFFGGEHWREFRHGHRRRTFQAAAKKATTPPKHVCRVCGISADDAPRMLFRYCSKCAGQACYCPEHIRDHEHVAEPEPTA
jgi:hypothetical protein